MDGTPAVPEHHHMKGTGHIRTKAFSFVLLAGLSGCAAGCNAQPTSGNKFLSLQQAIKLPEVTGRIDHLSVDTARKIVYMAALGSNTVEVIDLQAGKVVHAIKGDEPQGVVYLPATNAVFVANGGNGICTFYDAATYRSKRELDFHEDADDVRYSPAEQLVYVGYGSGGIALVSATTMKIIATIRLPGHPEGFQADGQAKRIWVNVPDARSVFVLDTKSRKIIAQWKIKGALANFPMAYDSKDQRLFIGCRSPSRLVVLDSKTGKKIAEPSCVGDADDLFYDTITKRILVSGGGGYIDIFQQRDANNYVRIAHIPSRGGARTSLWIPEWRELLLAAPARNGQPAGLLVYKMNE